MLVLVLVVPWAVPRWLALVLVVLLRGGGCRGGATVAGAVLVLALALAVPWAWLPGAKWSIVS